MTGLKGVCLRFLGWVSTSGQRPSAAPECQDRAGAEKFTAGPREAGAGTHAGPRSTCRFIDPTGLLCRFLSPCDQTSGARGGFWGRRPCQSIPLRSLSPT